MNRYSKTRLRQGLLPRQPQPEAPPEAEPATPPAERKSRGVAHEEQALLFDLADDFTAPPSGPGAGRAPR